MASSFVASTLKEIFADNTAPPRAITFEANPDGTSRGISLLVSPPGPHHVHTAVFAKSQTVQSAGGRFETTRPNKTHPAFIRNY